MCKSKVNKDQVHIMESLGFVFNSLDSSSYNAFWDFHLHPDVTCSDKNTIRINLSPEQEKDRIDTIKIIRSLGEMYYKKGQNSVISPIVNALQLRS